MDIIGYLFTMVNLQHLSNVNPPLKDTSFQLASLYELSKELVSMPNFPLDGYRRNGLQRHGNLVIYASNNLRDFVFNGLGSPDDEGFIIRLQYSDDKADVSKYDRVTYIIQREEVSEPIQKEIMKFLKNLDSTHRRKRANKLITTQKPNT